MTQKRILIPIIAVIAIISPLAFADEFRMPFNPANLIDHWVEVVFNPTDDGGVDVKVKHTSLFHYDNIIAMPDRFYIQVLDQNGGISFSDAIEIRHFYEDSIAPTIEPEPEEPKLPPEQQARIDEKIAEREKVVEEALRCVLGIEGSSLFTEYRELAVLKQMLYFTQLPLSYQDKQIILWTEECEKWSASYLSNYRQYEDIYLDQQRTPAYSRVLDESDSVYTDPLTADDFLQEIEDAENLPKPYRDPYAGCIPKDETDTRCEPRGGYTEGLDCGLRPAIAGQFVETMCPLQSQADLLNQAVSEEQNYENIQQLVCDSYLNHYQSIVDRIIEGDETAQLPNWLAHCQVNKQ